MTTSHDTHARRARGLVRATVLLLVTLGLASGFAVPAGAVATDGGPGGSNLTECSPLKTICVNVSANDLTYCSEPEVPGPNPVQCTPIAAGSAATAQPTAGLGGAVSWNVTASCLFRKRADGLNNDWTPWQHCNPPSKAGSGSRNWGPLASPQGGTTVLQWGSIVNGDTPGAKDCVEVRLTVTTSATAYSHVGGVPIEHVAATKTFGPNLSGICEGGSPY